MAVIDPNAVKSVTAGSTVIWRAGPFRNSAGALIDFSTGWTLTANLQSPACVTTQYTAEPDPDKGNGYFRYVSPIGLLTEGRWKGKLQAVSSTLQRFTVQREVKIVPLITPS